MLFVRAFADDLVIVVERNKLNSCLDAVVDWGRTYNININSNKLGIIRVLKRLGKILGVYNVLGINEVMEYKYFGIWVDQSLSFKKQISEVKSRSNLLWKKLAP
jgi:predicted SpoU family rRNA methylase